MDEIQRALGALYRMMEDSDSLGLSRGARLRIVGVIGDLEAAVLRRQRQGDEESPAERPDPDASGQP